MIIFECDTCGEQSEKRRKAQLPREWNVTPLYENGKYVGFNYECPRCCVKRRAQAPTKPAVTEVQPKPKPPKPPKPKEEKPKKRRQRKKTEPDPGQGSLL